MSPGVGERQPVAHFGVTPILLDVRRGLFAGLVDYAGLLPPASLTVEDAVAGYRRARSGPHADLLGRFTCPASHLEELAGVLMGSMPRGEPPWGISVILDGDLAAAVGAAQTFIAAMSPAAEVTFCEVRLSPVVGEAVDGPVAAGVIAPVFDAAAAVSPTVVPFFEMPPTPRGEIGVEAAIAGVARLRRERHRLAGVELRCGGLEASAFPAAEQAARFIVSCRVNDVPFKVPAGLDQPIRLRDEPDGIVRHGFINILVAAAFAEGGAPVSMVTEIIEEDDADAFAAGVAGLRWRDRLAGAATIARLRRSRFSSFGSCSFDEPVAGLVGLGMLGEAG